MAALTHVQSMAAFKHITHTVLDQDDGSPLLRELTTAGVSDIFDLLSLNKQQIDALNYNDSGTMKLLDPGNKNKVTIFFITHDLEEAIFLGHRLIIMSSRPCKPKKIVEVDIPHPRDYSVLTSPRFREIMNEAKGVVNEEARKAFEAGEKEG